MCAGLAIVNFCMKQSVVSHFKFSQLQVKLLSPHYKSHNKKEVNFILIISNNGISSILGIVCSKFILGHGQPRATALA